MAASWRAGAPSPSSSPRCSSSRPDRSFSRKIKEALLAFELEKRYSKDRLLELYLNQVYMGHGAFGVEAAARMYFGKSVQDLTLPEASMLAALPRSPGNYSPFERPELAQRRRAIVVGRLLEHGYISEAEAKATNRAPLGLVPSERRRGSGQYFLEYLQQSLEAKYGSDVLYKSGLAVYTTLDPALQRAAEQALREGLQALAGRQGARAAARSKGSPAPVAVPEGAVVVIEAATGYVKALIGGADFARTEFNRALHAHRQPGSAFKPFVYLAALEAGHAPTEILDDSPVRYVSAGKVWAPENYDGKFRGPVTLQQALEESINVPTIRLLEQLGVNPVIEAARRAGIQSPLPHDLTLALGSGDVTLLELTAAYGTFANQGVRMEPLMVRYVTDAQGRLVEENIPQGREAIDPGVANRSDPDAPRRRRARHRGRRAGARAAPRRQDGHDQRLLERLVRGLHALDRGRGLGRPRSAPEPRPRGDRRARGAADLGRGDARRRSGVSPSRTSPSRPPRRRAPRRRRGPEGRATRGSARRGSGPGSAAPGAARRSAPPGSRRAPRPPSAPRRARAGRRAALPTTPSGVRGGPPPPPGRGTDRPRGSRRRPRCPRPRRTRRPAVPTGRPQRPHRSSRGRWPSRSRSRSAKASWTRAGAAPASSARSPRRSSAKQRGCASRSAVSRATASIIRAPWPRHSRSSRSRRNGWRMSK